MEYYSRHGRNKDIPNGPVARPRCRKRGCGWAAGSAHTLVLHGVWALHPRHLGPAETLFAIYY